MTTIATFYVDKNYDGAAYNLLTTTNLSNPNLANGFPNLSNVISSIQCFDPNYIVYVYTGINYTGTTWAFRAPTNVADLSQYGLNDSIKSIQAQFLGAPGIGCTVFQEPGVRGRSNYIGGPVTVLNITNTGFAGNIGQNTLSSLWIYNNTRVILYADVNCVNQLGSPIVNTSGIPRAVDVADSQKDRCKSIIVTNA